MKMKTVDNKNRKKKIYKPIISGEESSGQTREENDFGDEKRVINQQIGFEYTANRLWVGVGGVRNANSWKIWRPVLFNGGWYYIRIIRCGLSIRSLL